VGGCRTSLMHRLVFPHLNLYRLRQPRPEQRIQRFRAGMCSGRQRRPVRQPRQFRFDPVINCGQAFQNRRGDGVGGGPGGSWRQGRW
jgi:hypothetical protein